MTYSNRLLALPAVLLSLILCLCALPVQAQPNQPDQAQAAVEVWAGAQAAAKVYYNEAAPTSASAAKALAKYLSTITATQVQAAKLKTPSADKGFYVGFRKPQSDNPKATFSVEVTPKGQVFLDGLDGNDDVHVAVMDLVQNELGCKIWSHNEEDIPVQTKLAFKPGVRAPIPAFNQIFMFNNEASAMPGEFRYAIKAVHGPQFTGNHTLYPLLEAAAKEHPEFFPADDKGVRKGNNLHFCYSAPGIAQALADALSKEVEKRKGNIKDYIYFAGMGDWYGGFCKCPTCTAIYKEETWINPDGKAMTGLSATLVRMMNQTGAILDKKYPGIQIGTFAYMSLDNPPGITKPAANVHIQLPRLRYDTCTPVDVSPANRKVYLAMQRWAEIAPNRLYIWEYGANYSSFLDPFPVTHSMAQNIKVYAKMGVAGILMQGNYVSPGSDMVVLRNWVWSRLFWNPELDTDALIKQFCEGYYGPAAPKMIEYINALDDSVKNPHIVVSEFSDANKTFLKPELEAKLYAIIDDAVKAAQSDATGKSATYLRRVKEARSSLEAARLWRPGPLVEKNNRLVRSDFPSDTYDDARDLLAHIRNASPREFGTGKNYHMGFMTRHGGPLLVIKEDKLQAAIAPTQGGLTRITFDGIDVIGNLYTQPVGCDGTFVEQGANYGSIKVETGVGNWSPNNKAWNLSYFQVLPGNKLRIQTTLTQVAKPEDPARAGSRTSYKLINGEAPKIERISLGTAIDIPYKAPIKRAAFPRFDTLRITYPKAGIVIEDTYPGVEGLSGDISQATATSGVAVTINTQPMELTTNHPTEAPVRVLTFTRTK
jgi:hypothetical protein